MIDAQGVQRVTVTVTTAGLEQQSDVTVHEETRLLAVLYGPVLLYVEDRHALDLHRGRTDRGRAPVGRRASTGSIRPCRAACSHRPARWMTAAMS